MIKTALLAMLLAVSSQSLLAKEPVNLERTMKTMGFAHKQASDASTTAEALPFVEKLQKLVQQAKQAPLPSDKAEVYNEGLDKVLAELALAKAAVTADDLPKLKQHLQQIEQLKKQYHKERKFSFWQLIFGKY